ncbi:hypothetical protein EV122DRAFT_278765 [Schizophyllum commune]
MPTIACSTRAVASSDHNGVALAARHYLTAGEATEPTHDTKCKLPSGVDILASSTVSLVLHGSHAAQLGLVHVGDVCCDGSDGLPRIRLDIERCSAAGQTNQHLTLTQIGIHFRWTTSSDCTSDSSPFATRLSLAHRSLLLDAIHRFATYHLVRRYPLIFGTWHEQMDIEYRLAAKIYDSITSIISRSSNNAFREACGRLLKKLHRQRKAAARSSASALQEYMGPAYDPARGGDDPPHAAAADDTDEEDNDEDGEHLADLQFAMQRLYRATVKRPRFKGSHQGRPSRDSDAEDEELTRLPSPKGRRSSDAAQAAQDLLDAPDLRSGDESSTTGPPLTPMDDNALWVGLEPVSPSRKELGYEDMEDVHEDMAGWPSQVDEKMFPDEEGIVDDEDIADEGRMPLDDYYDAFDDYGGAFDESDEWEGDPDRYVYFHHCALDEFDAGLVSHSDMSVYESDDSLLLECAECRADNSDDGDGAYTCLVDDAYTSLVDVADNYSVNHATEGLLDERYDAIDIDTDEEARLEGMPSSMPTRDIADDNMLSDEDVLAPLSPALDLTSISADMLAFPARTLDPPARSPLAQISTAYATDAFAHDLLEDDEDEEQPPVSQETLAADDSDSETDDWDFNTSYLGAYTHRGSQSPANYSSTPSLLTTGFAACPSTSAPVHPNFAFSSVIYPPEPTATYSPEPASIKSPEPPSPIEALDSSSLSSGHSSSSEASPSDRSEVLLTQPVPPSVRLDTRSSCTSLPATYSSTSSTHSSTSSTRLFSLSTGPASPSTAPASRASSTDFDGEASLFSDGESDGNMDVDPVEGLANSCEPATESLSSQDSACESGSSSPASATPYPPASEPCDTLDFDDDGYLDAQDRPDNLVSSAPPDMPLSRDDSQAPYNQHEASPAHASYEEPSASQGAPLTSQEADLSQDEVALNLDEPDCAMDEANCALSSGVSSADNAPSDVGGVAVSEVTLPLSEVSSDSLSFDGVNSSFCGPTPRLSAVTPPLSSLAPPLSGPGLALNVATSRIDDARQGSCAARPGFDEGALFPERRVWCSEDGATDRVEDTLYPERGQDTVHPEKDTMYTEEGVMYSQKDTMRLETQAGAMPSVPASPVSPLDDDIWCDDDLEVLTVVAEASQSRLGASSAGMKAGGQALGWEADLAGDTLDLADDAHDLADDALFHDEDIEQDRERGHWRLAGDATGGSSTDLWQAGALSRDEEGLLSDGDDDLR